MLARRLGKRLVGPLNNALSTDINPGACGHLTEHHQAGPIKFVKMLPGCPTRDQIRIRNQHPGRVFMRAKNANRFARLNQQGFIGRQCLERLKNRLEAIPVAGRLADTPIDHKRLRIFSDLGIQIVLDHPPGALNQPVAAVQCAATGRSNRSGLSRHDLHGTLIQFSSTHSESAHHSQHNDGRFDGGPRSARASDHALPWQGRQ